MVSFQDWWNTLEKRQKTIVRLLVKATIKKMVDSTSDLEQIVDVILSDQKLLEMQERNHLMHELTSIANTSLQILDRISLGKEEEELVLVLEKEIQNNIEIKADVLKVVLKNGYILSQVVDFAIKVAQNQFVDHEKDLETLLQEAQSLQWWLDELNPYDDMDIGELLEWEINLEGCPNLDCQYVNPPNADVCQKCGFPLIIECPSCYNEIPIHSSYCRVCGKEELDNWNILNRYVSSIKYALEKNAFGKALHFVKNMPEDLMQYPEIQALKEEHPDLFVPAQEKQDESLESRITLLRQKWVDKIQQILEERRPDFVLANRFLSQTPDFLKNQEFDQMGKHIEEKQKIVVAEGRKKKLTLILQQVDILQEKGEYQKALLELEKLSHSFKNELLVLSKQKELHRTIEYVQKLKDLLQGPDWAHTGEAQRKCALLEKFPVAREFDLGGVNLNFILIPSGSFLMGAEDGYANEKPRHKISISKAFYLAITPVTQEQWHTIIQKNPSHFEGKNFPVEQITWQECCDFLMMLSKKFSEFFRLPTEAEWEYACRAGTQDCYFFGKDSSSLSEFAWFNKNSDKQTHEVSLLKENGWGLYDILGNVWEWCQDTYDENYYEKSSSKDPMGPLGEKNSVKVCRGGGWNSIPSDLRVSARQGVVANSSNANVGFRPLLEIRRN